MAAQLRGASSSLGHHAEAATVMRRNLAGVTGRDIKRKRPIATRVARHADASLYAAFIADVDSHAEAAVLAARTAFHGGRPPVYVALYPEVPNRHAVAFPVGLPYHSVECNAQ